MDGTCSGCSEYFEKLHYTFGEYLCKNCIDKRSSDRDGHSGMVEKDVDIENFYEYGLEGLNLIRVKKSNPLFVKLFFEHYPDSKGIVGRQLSYLIYNDEEPIGVIGFASPPYKYNKFCDYFNEDDPNNLSTSILNNNVYRLIKSEKNWATQILRKARETLYIDYKEKYNEKLKGLVTFVELPLEGTLYKADNWDNLGKTQGVKIRRRGKNWKNKWKDIEESVQKHIYAWKYNNYNGKLNNNSLYFSYNHGIRGRFSRLEWLNNIRGIGKVTRKKILNQVDFDDFLRMSQSDLKTIHGIGASTSKKAYYSITENSWKYFVNSRRLKNSNYWKNVLRDRLYNHNNSNLEFILGDDFIGT